MTHLGTDVAAYVDGQLSASASAAADAHLATCDVCSKAVRQQRLTKSRMSTGAVPGPPPDLVDALARLGTDVPETPSLWTRLKQHTPVTVGLAVVGASVTVLAVAYAMGGTSRGDDVSPGFDQLAVEFFGSTPATVAATFSTMDPEQLHAQGWPCHETLGGLDRTSAGFDRSQDTVLVTYTDGVHRLKLYEQPGRLDAASVAGFEQRRLGGAPVWLKAGAPTVATWDRDGIVFTVVTDLPPERIADAITELPIQREQSPIHRIGDGLERLGDWATAA